MNDLKSRLRLNGVQTETQPIIDEQVRAVRVSLYDALGTTRVMQILAIPDEANPSSTDGLLRSRASTLEVNWVRLLLLRTMPILLMPGTPGTTQAWNEARISAPTGISEIDREIKRLESDIAAAIEALKGETTPVSGTNVSVIGPSCRNKAPGSSIYT